MKDLESSIEGAGDKLSEANSKWKKEDSKIIIESVFIELKKIGKVK